MSDSAAPVATAPATESAPSVPQTTEAITANVIEQLDAADSSSETPPGETRINTADVTATAETKPAPAPTQAELSAAAKFLLKQGHQLKKVDGRDTWLPAKTVEGMLDRYVEEHRNTWTGERTTLESQAKELRDIVDQLRTGVSGDPDAFLRELATHDQRYARYLQPQAAQPQTPAFDGEMPQPDFPLPDGSRTYSLDGIQKQLIPWLTQAITKQLEAKVDERLRPITEREKKEQERAAQEEIHREIQTRTSSRIQEAQTWPGFGTLAPDGSLSEFQTAVLKRLQDDTAKATAANRRPSMTLREAYLEVHAERLAADDTTKRARWMDEQNKAPRSTSMTRAGAELTKPAGPRTTEDITRETLERMGA